MKEISASACCCPTLAVMRFLCLLVAGGGSGYRAVEKVMPRYVPKVIRRHVRLKTMAAMILLEVCSIFSTKQVTLPKGGSSSSTEATNHASWSRKRIPQDSAATRPSCRLCIHSGATVYSSLREEMPLRMGYMETTGGDNLSSDTWIIQNQRNFWIVDVKYCIL